MMEPCVEKMSAQSQSERKLSDDNQSAVYQATKSADINKKSGDFEMVSATKQAVVSEVANAEEDEHLSGNAVGVKECDNPTDSSEHSRQELKGKTFGEKSHLNDVKINKDIVENELAKLGEQGHTVESVQAKDMAAAFEVSG